MTYWDYLGWKDTFAKPEFTERQVSYERGLGHSGPFTPQIVVNGSADTVGNEFSAVQQLVNASHVERTANFSRRTDSLDRRRDTRDERRCLARTI